MKWKYLIISIITIIVISLAAYYFSGNLSISSNVGKDQSMIVAPNAQQAHELADYMSKVLQATSTDACRQFPGAEYNCVVNLVLKNKNPKLCEYFIQGPYRPIPSMENSCLVAYMSQTKDMSACALMSTAPDSDYNYYLSYTACPNKPAF